MNTRSSRLAALLLLAAGLVAALTVSSGGSSPSPAAHPAAVSHDLHPLDIAQSGHYLYVASAQSAGIKISEYDSSSGAYLRTLPLTILSSFPSVPMLATPSKFFVTSDLGKLLEFDNASGALSHSFDPPKAFTANSDSYAGHLFTDGSILYATASNFDEVAEISLASNTLLRTLSSSPCLPISVCSAANGTIYAAQLLPRLSATSALTGQARWATQWTPPSQPANALFTITDVTPVNGALFLTAVDGSGPRVRAALVNPATGAISHNIGYSAKGSFAPAATAYVNGQIFIYNQGASTVTQIDPSSMTVVRTISVPANSKPTRLSLAGTDALFVANASSVTEYSTSTGALLATFK